MRRLVMWLVAVGVSVSLVGCTSLTGGGDTKAPAKATTAAKAVTTAAKAVTK